MRRFTRLIRTDSAQMDVGTSFAYHDALISAHGVVALPCSCRTPTLARHPQAIGDMK